MPLFRPYEHRRSAAQASDVPDSSTAAADEPHQTQLADEPGPVNTADAPRPTSTRRARATSTGPEAVAADSTEAGTTRTRLQPKSAQKKNQPTRSRAEAERARREQLHPVLTPKEAKARARESRFQARQDSLARQEATPERELLRDYIDSRWTWAEFILPVFVLLWATSMATAKYLQVQYALSIAMVLAMVLMFLNVWWVWRGYKREAYARISHPNFRGLALYCMNRMIWIRRFRRPPPRISRGDAY